LQRRAPFFGDKTARAVRRLRARITVLAFIACGSGAALADQSSLTASTNVDGPVLAFDWPALEIGIGSYEAGPTGVTVVHFKNRAAVAVDVRGGGPGTVNTDHLRLGYPSAFVDAVVFAGGSAYGEEAITAVATALKDDGIRGAGNNVALVPGAIIYDFGRRLNEIYPDKRLAVAALHARRPGLFPLGAQGAGRMATQGLFFGCDAHSGQGGAFRQLGPTKIAAFVVVNPFGAVTDRAGKLVSCHRAPGWGALNTTAELLQHLPASLKPAWEAGGSGGTTRNTTISLIVTNQKLEPWALQRLAVQVHTSMARAIQPFATLFDGDTLFAASTQEHENKDLGLVTLGAIGSELMWDAILASVPQQAVATAPTTRVALATDQLAKFTGTFAVGSLARLTVRVAAERLVIEATGKSGVYEFEVGKPVAVVAASDREFYVDGRYHTRIAFTADASGRVIGAVINPGRWEQRAERVGD
jgi:6-aminohexanoate-oligomer endohydrolase